MPQFSTSDGLSIHYEFEGSENDGPPAVFLNGMTQTTRHWASLSRKLREWRPILTYDARGQGTSDDPTSTPTLAEHTRDLAELLDHLKIEKADLAGFSHGARLAIGFATEYPERLRRLVACSATAKPTALARTIIRSWIEVLEHGGLAALSWAAIPSIVGSDFLEKNEPLLKNIVRASVDRNSEEGTRHLLNGLANFPPLDDLAGKISAPTLIISATGDPLVSLDGAKKLAELCGGTHELIENCGHTIPIERPETFRRLVKDFFS